MYEKLLPMQKNNKLTLQIIVVFYGIALWYLAVDKLRIDRDVEPYLKIAGLVMFVVAILYLIKRADEINFKRIAIFFVFPTLLFGAYYAHKRITYRSSYEQSPVRGPRAWWEGDWFVQNNSAECVKITFGNEYSQNYAAGLQWLCYYGPELVVKSDIPLLYCSELKTFGADIAYNVYTILDRPKREDVPQVYVLAHLVKPAVSTVLPLKMEQYLISQDNLMFEKLGYRFKRGDKDASSILGIQLFKEKTDCIDAILEPAS